MTSRILLTGAGGFVGRALVRRLKSDNRNFVTLGRGDEPVDAGTPHVTLDLLAASTSDLRKVLSRIEPDGIIHAAWYTDHADYLVNPVNRDWLEASLRLVAEFPEFNPQGRFVGLGSCAEYPPEGGRLTEGVATGEPATLYGKCKLELSRRLEARPNTAWARLFFIYGPGDRQTRLVPQLLEAAMAGEHVMARHGALRRDYIHVDDLASQIVALYDSDVRGVVNTGTGTAATLATLARFAAQAAGKPELAVTNDIAPDDQPLLIEADMTRYTDAVGPLACRSLSDGISGLLDLDNR